MAILILAENIATDWWFAEFIARWKDHEPDIELRLWPDCGPRDEIDIVLAWGPPPSVLHTLPNLKQIISLGASVDRILADPDLPAHVPIHRIVSYDQPAQMAAYVLFTVSLFQRRFLEYQALQRSQSWEYLPIPDASSFTVGILGLGVLGSAVAKKLVSSGFPVRGWSRTPKEMENVACFHGSEQFQPFLNQCQVIVCLLPMTTETEGILCRETFLSLPIGAYIINVGRGNHLIEADLLRALDSGQIAGACLDVFSAEPLPSNHPFWSHTNIIVTPHISAIGMPRDVADCVVDIVIHGQAGTSSMYLVNHKQGY